MTAPEEPDETSELAPIEPAYETWTPCEDRDQAELEQDEDDDALPH